MLRVTQQASAAAAKSYYSAADYYTQGQELPGEWGGRGADRLGLSGEVTKDAFDRLCDNRHPTADAPLTARTRSARTVGYDFTFSVPKSVSVLYGLTADPRLLDAFRGAVADTMTEIESEAKARVRRGGRDDDRATGNLVYATFVHTTARPVGGVPDPHLHAHAFVFNATYDAHDRAWKAGQFRYLKRDAPYFQAAFRVRLAGRLQAHGFAVARRKDDFELAGAPAGVVTAFSRRTQAVEAAAERLGVTDPKAKDGLGKATRERKATNQTWADLQAGWRQRLSADDRAALARVQAQSAPVAVPAGGERAAVDHALAHLFERDAAVPVRALHTEALKRGLGAVTVAGVQSELARRPLLVGRTNGRELATTREVLAEERRLVAFARSGRGMLRPLAPPDRPVTRAWLNPGQRAAVAHVLTSRDCVTLVRGAAGTGKTTLQQEIGEALRAAGVGVVAIAPSAAASRGVLREEAGFVHADTVAKFLADRSLREQARGGVVLLDEASLVGTRDALAVCDAVRDLDARLVLVGDRAQHRSVARGQPLKLLETEAGLPVAEVTEILRQRGDYKRATAALAAGKLEAGFRALDDLRWVHEMPDGEREAALAAAYLAASAETKADGSPVTALVVAPTHAEGERVTAAIRGNLKVQGRLADETVIAAWRPAQLTAAEKADPTSYEPGDLLRFHQHAPGHRAGSRLVVADPAAVPVAAAARFELYRPFALPLAAGDRVRVTAPGTTRDGKHRLETGSVYTLTGFDRRGDLVLDNGWAVARDFGHLAHGYAATSHASQGRTVDRVFVAASTQSFRAVSARQLYVSASRGKERVELFTDDKAGLLAAARRADEPTTALDVARGAAGFGRRLAAHWQRLRRAAWARDHDPAPNRFERTTELTREAAHER